MPPIRKAAQFKIRDVLPDYAPTPYVPESLRNVELPAERTGPVVWTAAVFEHGTNVDLGCVAGPEQDLFLLLDFVPEERHTQAGIVTILRHQGGFVDPAYSWDTTAKCWVLREDV